jgi:hypothetical protein
MEISFVYLNLGIDKWLSQGQLRDFNEYINEHANIKMRQFRDGDMDGSIDENNKIHELGMDGNVFDTVNMYSNDSYNHLPNVIDNTITYTCYIKNRFFQLFNAELINKIKAQTDSDIFVFSEFCNINKQLLDELQIQVGRHKKLKILKTGLDLIDLSSYYVQKYGTPGHFKKIMDIDHIGKHFLIGSRNKDYNIRADELANCNYDDAVNELKCQYIDNKIGNRRDFDFGCIQYGTIIPTNENMKPILIVNIHNRFHSADDVAKAIDKILKRTEENIIFIGDVNVFGKNKDKIRLKNKSERVYIADIETILKQFGFSVMEMGDYYEDIRDKCDKREKYLNLRVFHRLKHYKFNTELPHCDFDINVSSHNMIKFNLVREDNVNYNESEWPPLTDTTVEIAIVGKIVQKRGKRGVYTGKDWGRRDSNRKRSNRKDWDRRDSNRKGSNRKDWDRRDSNRKGSNRKDWDRKDWGRKDWGRRND